MDGIINTFLLLVKDAPGYFVLTIGFIAGIFALYIKVRSININEVTSIGKFQSEQMSLLITQVTLLSKDLAEARKEISHLYDKIDELEDIIRKYKNKLRDEEIDFPDTKSPEDKND